jgi:hypothetical protein
LTCPYCGTVENMQHYHTQEQVEWIKSMMFRDIAKALQDTMRNAFKPIQQHKSGSMFSISMSYKPGSLPSVRHYVEEKLKRTVICDNCSFKYAVYGISFHCPLCGHGNLLTHLKNSAETIRILIRESNLIGEKYGRDVSQKMIENALEDVVSLFEGFLKNIYQYEIKRRFSKEESDKKISEIRVNFQRIDGAEDFFRRNLCFELISFCRKEDRDLLIDQFLKRHVITHNLGMIDTKYLAKAKTFEKEGSEIEIIPNELLKFLELVEKIVINASSHFVVPAKN